MHHLLADTLRQYFATVSFADRVGGLVRVKEKLSSDGKTILGLPICYTRETNVTSTADYVAMYPDSSLRSLMYFEESGSMRLVDQRGKRSFYQTNLRLVLWLNVGKINAAAPLVPWYYELAHARATSEIMARCTGQTWNDPMERMQGITLRAVDLYPDTPGLFSGYTYDQRQRDYLMHPYVAAGVNIEVKFSVSGSCLDWYAGPTVFPPAVVGNPLESTLNTLDARIDLLEAGASTIAYPAGEVLGGGKLVYLLDGKLYLYHVSSPTLMGRLLGVTLAAGVVDQPVAILTEGKFPYGGLVPGAQYFASDNGSFTNVRPQSGILQHVGHALTDSELQFTINTPIKLL